MLDEATRLVGEDRTRYLESSCAGDAQLRGEIESLLHAIERSGSFMSAPLVPMPDIPVETPGQAIERSLDHDRKLYDAAFAGTLPPYLRRTTRTGTAANCIPWVGTPKRNNRWRPQCNCRSACAGTEWISANIDGPSRRSPISAFDWANPTRRKSGKHALKPLAPLRKLCHHQAGRLEH